MTPLVLSAAVGKNCPNKPTDVKAVHQRLMDIAKIPCYVTQGAMDDTILKGIVSVQRHFLAHPDGVIAVGGRTQSFLSRWSTKRIAPGVQLPGRLKEAWELVSPLLPDQSYCSSGFRSPEDQRRILHGMFVTQYRSEIVRKFGQQRYDKANANLVANEADVLEMVRGVGQQIAAPGKSKHQIGKAIDIGGPSSIDKMQAEVVGLVARANSSLLSGVVVRERNGCVHFEIR